MSILKALQKKRVEQPAESEAAANVVPFEKNGKRRINNPPELFVNNDLKIGTPDSAFIEQSDSYIGKALPDLETEITAGATLNAVGLTRTPEKLLPDFIKWEVDNGARRATPCRDHAAKLELLRRIPQPANTRFA